jgi:ribosome-associated toxin RatA of RatAB toxin-antitoxin module
MWEIKEDEFNFSETVDINVPPSIVYETAARVDRYDRFLTDVATARMESEGICKMILRAGPLRVNLVTKVTVEENKRIDFAMIEGPPVKLLAGAWIIVPNSEGGTNVTLKVTIKAGRAGKWLLKTLSRYMERKTAALIEAFQQQAMRQPEAGESASLSSPSSTSVISSVQKEIL